MLEGDKSVRVAVEWATHAARALRGDLHVVVVRSKRARDDPAIVLKRIVDQIDEIAPAIEIDAEIHTGGVRSNAVKIGMAKRVGLVVVRPEVPGEEVTAIADELGVPVLVARTPRGDGRIVATTDMKRGDYPVLSASSRFARVLRKPLSFFHNATPMSVTLNPLGAPLHINDSGLLDDSDAKASQLRDLADAVGNAEAIVAQSDSTVSSILQAAHDRNADIVTVGHAKRSWFLRMFRRHVPAQLVDQWQRNVLIIPIA